ncbi:MAG: hypothetical protein GY950_04890, partial [bacterium]|nr:hypothetical protein [bacterium]
GDERYQEGFDLLDAAERRQVTKQEKSAEQRKAREELRKVIDESHDKFSVHVKFTRLAYRKEPEKLKELGIDIAIAGKTNVNGWLTQTKFYYPHAVADTELHPLLSRNGITLEELQANELNVTAVEEANQGYRSAIAEAQAAVEARDKAIEDFQFWLTEFIALCRQATKDEPQLMEALKITVYSKGYKKKKPGEEQKEQPVENTEPTDTGTQASGTTDADPIQ